MAVAEFAAVMATRGDLARLSLVRGAGNFRLVHGLLRGAWQVVRGEGVIRPSDCLQATEKV